MLIKMLSRPLARPELHQLIKYINDGRESFADEKQFIIRYNTTGKTAQEVAEDFKRNNTLIKRRKGKQIGVQHIVCSFHPKEKNLLNDEKLFAFAQKFAVLMNFNDAIVFGRTHYEKKNTHLHFAVSASEFGSGKSRRIYKSKLKEIQIGMNRYQQRFPDLKHSLLYLPELRREQKRTISGIPLPEKMRETDGSIRAKERGQKSKLDILKDRLIQIAKKYPRKQDFIKAVNNETNIEVYYYRKRPNGIIDKNTGKKYRFRRFAIDLDNLKRDIRLHELDKQKQKNQERSLER